MSRIALCLVLLLGAWVLSGCGSSAPASSTKDVTDSSVTEETSTQTTPPVEQVKPGLPPNNPKDGYRHTMADGTQLVYDADLKVYRVSGVEEVYYQKKTYYRPYAANWLISKNVNGPWDLTMKSWIPEALRRGEHVQEGATANE